MPKATELALRVTAAPLLAVVPVPAKDTDWGEPVALSAMLMLADLEPVDTGLKVTERVQLAPPVRVEPQEFDRPKSSASAPASAMELKVTVALPLFLRVTVCAAEVAFAAVEAKLTVVGDTVSEAGVVDPEPTQAFTRLYAFTEPNPVARS